jgi:hypothetical protein
VHRNIFLGIAAWLLGAATATAGCLLAVSLLGSGITAGGSGQLLSQDAANRELASEAAKSAPGETPAPAASTDPDPTLASVTPSPVPSSASPPPASTPGPPTAAATGSGGTATAAMAPSGSASAGTVLASSAGDVVATCQAAGAYLISWSPLQGYEVGDVSRGPAAAARVTFESHADELTMTVSCSGGVPSATTTSSWGGDD